MVREEIRKIRRQVQPFWESQKVFNSHKSFNAERKCKQRKNFYHFFISDLNELNLPKTCATDFPDPDDLLNFKLVICPDEGYYKGGRFVFTFKVRIKFSIFVLLFVWSTLFVGESELPSWAAKSEMWNTSVSSEYWSGRKCLLKYFTRRLEARLNDQFCRLRATVSVSGKFCSGHSKNLKHVLEKHFAHIRNQIQKIHWIKRRPKYSKTISDYSSIMLGRPCEGATLVTHILNVA